MKEKVLFVFFVLLVYSSRGEKNPRFNFPDSLEPKEYLVRLKTDFKNEKRFWGDVVIKATCLESTRKIVINAKDLDIDESSVKVKLVSEEAEINIDISEPDTIPDAEQYVIPVKTDLVAERQYEIRLSFSRHFAHDFDVYHFYSLIDEKSKTKEYFGFTRIGPGQARTLFPLIDQMKFKASFEIIHDHPRGVTAFSNMPLQDTLDSSQGADWQSDVFVKSIPIASHTIGFALADLKQRKNKDPTSGATISIWSNDRTFPATNFLLKIIIRIFDFYSDFFKVNYPLPKMDILIMPEYKGGYEKTTAGLIIFGNSTTLYDELMDINEKTEMAKEMCEAVCRQWIGMYTTMSRWNQHWLHRALVHLFSPPCIEKAFPHDDWKHYVDSSPLVPFTDVLENDLDKFGDPIYSPDDNEDYSYSIPDSVASEKAYLIVRMLRLTLGEVVFQESVEEYLRTYGEKKITSSLEQVWEIFTKKATAAKSLPSGISVEEIMNSWSTKARYPVFIVKRDYETNMVTVKQEPFVPDEEERKKGKAVSAKDCWISPITYKTEDGPVDSQNMRWFSCIEDELKIDLGNLPATNWIIFNLRIIAPCRTLYDFNNWKSLSQALMNKEALQKIDDLTRADLLFDMFEFARARKPNELNYSFVFDTLQYLVYEDSYLVWLVVEHEMEKLFNNLFRTKIFDSFQKYMKGILTKVYDEWEEKEFAELDTIDPYMKQKNLILNLACRFGVGNCEEQCLKLFDDWYNNLQSVEDQTLLQEIRDTVLCGAVKQNNGNWSKLLDKYNRSNRLSMNSSIFWGMGCSTNLETLNEYLEMILGYNPDIADSDKEEIFNSLVWNKDGYPLAKEFLLTKYTDIEKRFPGKTNFVDSYLERLLNATTTKEDLNEITDFRQKIRPTRNTSTDDDTLYEEHVAKIKKNIQWYEKNENELTKFFENHQVV